MSRTSLALAIAASLGAAALVPDAAGAFALGHDRAANFGRGITLPTPQNGLRASALVHARIRCHSVQPGDPRKQPPMLVCP